MPEPAERSVEYETVEAHDFAHHRLALSPEGSFARAARGDWT